jgi:hypothetical protein
MPERATFSEDGSYDDLPVTCVTPIQARQYCAWLGGALPTAEQWLVAVRGEKVRRYPWGDTTPGCDHHPLARTSGESGPLCCGDDCFGVGPFRTGVRAANVSPSGVIDALLVKAELVEREVSSLFSTCAGQQGACAVRGIAPGAIDGFVTIPDDPDPATYKGELPVYAFRCAWSEVSR